MPVSACAVLQTMLNSYILPAIKGGINIPWAGVQTDRHTQAQNCFCLNESYLKLLHWLTKTEDKPWKYHPKPSHHLLLLNHTLTLGYPSQASSVDGSAKKIKLKSQMNAISTLSILIAELSLRTTWHVTRHVAHDKRSMCCTWFAYDCARATWTYVSETVRSAVRRWLKISNCAIQCDYYYYYHYYYYYRVYGTNSLSMLENT